MPKAHRRLEVSTADENPYAPLRLLSLDGGGVRGLSSLMVLKTLMETIAKEEKRLGRRSNKDHTPLKPCDYFDLIGGTSTGGIIAILLGRLQLDCEQCIKIYSNLAESIFKYDRSFRVAGIRIPTGTTRFSGAVLEQAIKSTLRDLGHDEEALMWDDTLFEEIPDLIPPFESIWGDDPRVVTESPTRTRSRGGEEETPLIETSEGNISYGTSSSQSSSILQLLRQNRVPTWRVHRPESVHRKMNEKGCRTFVVTTLKKAVGLPKILSTYDPNDRQTRIWEALRATSAAPTFFEEMTFGTPKVSHLDGGFGFNNPCAEVVHAAKSIWKGRAIGVIVSVGTGLQTLPAVKNSTSWLPFGLGLDIALIGALAHMATGTARVDNEMQREYYGSDTRYYRFDVDGGLANVSLEQWMKEDEMGALTAQYMFDPEQEWRGGQVAQLLVNFTTLPQKFEIRSKDFHVGMTGTGLMDGSFRQDQLDFKTGYPLGLSVSPSDRANLEAYRTTSPSGERGIMIDRTGRRRSVFPVAEDLDQDGRRQEAEVTTCIRSENVCLRILRRGIPQGRYRVKFVICLLETDHIPPTELVFSVGRPFDADTFIHRFVDVKITPDVVPVLLHPDAVRVRVGRTRYAETKGKGWVEIEGDVPIRVGLDGVLGMIISKKYLEDEFVGGWSFGGVKVVPVFGNKD